MTTRKVGAFAKQAGNRGLGRKKGVPNKFTGALKDMVRQALEEAGGVEYLTTQAKESPTAFLGLVGKLLPAEIKADVTGVIASTIDLGSLTPEQKRAIAAIRLATDG